jgi:hypothetical protein
MKYRYIFLLLLLGSCKKEDILPIPPQNNVSEIIGIKKNYLLPSYDLRKSDVWVDFYKIPQTLSYKYYDCGNAIADFNGDGYDDVLIAPANNTNTRQPLELYINDKTNNNFTFINDIILNNIGCEAPRKALVGDFNGDGKPDVFYADHGAEIGDGPFEGEYLSILLSGNQNYTFKILDNLLPKSFYHGATSGDFDKDGDLDIFVTQICAFLINDGKGNFTVDKSIYQYQTSGVYTCEMIDINKDGYLDLLIGGHSIAWDEIDSPKILLGNGKTFSADRIIELPDIKGWQVSVDFAYEDLNNDGTKEIVVSRASGGSNTFYNGFRIQILENIGNYKFMDKTENYIKDYISTNDTWIPWLRVQDIDKNGKMDIFTSDKGHKNSNISQRWERDTDGIFKLRN